MYTKFEQAMAQLEVVKDQLAHARVQFSSVFPEINGVAQGLSADPEEFIQFIDSVTHLNLQQVIEFLEQETAYIGEHYPHAFEAVCKERGKANCNSKEFLEHFTPLTQASVAADGADSRAHQQEDDIFDQVYLQRSKQAEHTDDIEMQYIATIGALRSQVQRLLGLSAKAHACKATVAERPPEPTKFKFGLRSIQREALSAFFMQLDALGVTVVTDILAITNHLIANPIFLDRHPNLPAIRKSGDAAATYTPRHHISPYVFTVWIPVILTFIAGITLGILATLGVVPIDKAIEPLFANFNPIARAIAHVATWIAAIVVSTAVVALFCGGFTKLSTCLYSVFASNTPAPSVRVDVSTSPDSTPLASATTSTNTSATTSPDVSTSTTPSGTPPSTPIISRRASASELEELQLDGGTPFAALLAAGTDILQEHAQSQQAEDKFIKGVTEGVSMPSGAIQPEIQQEDSSGESIAKLVSSNHGW